MKTRLLKMARRHLRIIVKDYAYELQYKEAEHWEYLYDGTLSETLRVMHNHMRRNLKPFYIETNAPKVVC
jgi:hypothetical protein